MYFLLDTGVLRLIDLELIWEDEEFLVRFKVHEGDFFGAKSSFLYYFSFEQNYYEITFFNY